MQKLLVTALLFVSGCANGLCNLGPPNPQIPPPHRIPPQSQSSSRDWKRAANQLADLLKAERQRRLQLESKQAQSAEKAETEESKTAAGTGQERRPAQSRERVAQPSGPDWVGTLLSLLKHPATLIGGPAAGLGVGVMGWLWRRRRRRRRNAPMPDDPPKQLNTDYVPYSDRTYRQAVVWAQREMASKYPGSVGTLQTFESFVNQYLSGHGRESEE